MKNHSVLFVLAGTFVLCSLFGCKENSTTGPATTDKEAMEVLVSADALFSISNEMIGAGDPSSSDVFSLGKTTADITPYFWGRKITSANRTVTFTVVSVDSAHATVTHTWTGYMWIYGKYPNNDTLKLFTKPLTETVSRNVIFARKDRDRDPRKNWKIVAISALAGGSVNDGISIQKAVFIIGSDSLEITNPLDYYFKIENTTGPHRLHAVLPSPTQGFKIQVTLVSADPDSDFVVAHRPIIALAGGVYRHKLMTLVSSTPNNDNTFTRVYEHTWQGAWAGRHHVMIGAITRQSLFDDTAVYVSRMWGIPYVVEP